MFKAEVDLIYILNCPKLQEMFQNMLGNSTKKNLSVYHSISLLAILSIKSNKSESKTKEMIIFKGDFSKSKSPRAKHITNDVMWTKTFNAVVLCSWKESRLIPQHLLRTNSSENKAQMCCTSPRRMGVHVHMDGINRSGIASERGKCWGRSEKEAIGTGWAATASYGHTTLTPGLNKRRNTKPPSND